MQVSTVGHLQVGYDFSQQDAFAVNFEGQLTRQLWCDTQLPRRSDSANRGCRAAPPIEAYCIYRFRRVRIWFSMTDPARFELTTSAVGAQIDTTSLAYVQRQAKLSIFVGPEFGTDAFPAQLADPVENVVALDAIE